MLISFMLGGCAAYAEGANAGAGASENPSFFMILLPGIIVIVVTIIIALAVTLYKARQPKLYDINSELSKIDQLDGQSFELWCAQLFRRLGFSRIITTKASGDYGADIVCFMLGERTVVQCKRYGKHVGIAPVQEILGAHIHYGASQMLVVTNNYFTPAAVKLANEAGVELWDRIELINKMKIANMMYSKEKKALQKKNSENADDLQPNQLSAANVRKVEPQANPGGDIPPVSSKHEYEFTIKRLYDESTYVLYRVATDENEALALIRGVIDINEKVVNIKDRGVAPIFHV